MKVSDIAAATYEAEIARKDKLVDSISFPAGILTALTAGLIAGLSSISIPLDIIEIVGLCLGLIAILCVAKSAFHLAASLTSYEYSYIENIEKLADWQKEFIERGFTQDEAEDQLDKFYVKEMVGCAALNTKNNDARSQQLYAANVWMIRAVVATFVAALPYILHEISGEALPTNRQSPTSSPSNDRKLNGHGERSGRSPALAPSVASTRSRPDARAAGSTAHQRADKSTQVPLVRSQDQK